MIYGIELIYFIAGAIGGLLLGIIGAGIGPIIIPVMIFCLPFVGINNSIIMHLAICTSLSVILATTLLSFISHHKNNSINWPLFFRLVPGSIIGAIFSATCVIVFTNQFMGYVFSIFLLLLGMRLFTRKKQLAEKKFPSYPVLFSLTGLIAFFSNILGVSDGILMVPFLKRYNVNILEAVGTVTALIIPISAITVVPLIIKGICDPHLPTLCFGYVYIPAFAAITFGSVIFSNVGVYVGKYLPERVVTNLFASSIILIGLVLMIKQ